jgi:hypothetical protein
MAVLALILAATLGVAPAQQAKKPQKAYPVHTGITATVFWVGEPVGNGSSENNALSAWDDHWLTHYGGVDAPEPRRSAPYFPTFTPLENPFYFDLPYNDFSDTGPRLDRLKVVPWAAKLKAPLAAAAGLSEPYSLLKNRWIKLWRVVDGEKVVCYAQWEDSGPYVYNDASYVFGRHDQRPLSKLAHNAGMDVSPAVRDALRFNGINNDENKVSWSFVDAGKVPDGPWKRVVTIRQVTWG